jgi:hypothetical protein
MMVYRCKIGLLFSNDNISRRFECPANGQLLFIKANNLDMEFRDDFTNDVNAVYYYDNEDLYSKLESILNDYESWYRLSTSSFNHIRSSHLIQHSAKYVINVVENLL